MSPSEILLDTLEDAEAGDTYAQVVVSTYYLHGGDPDPEGGDGFHGGDADGEKAVFWLERAAEQVDSSDSAEAQQRLGRLYEEGAVVQKDKGKAMRLYERAAARNNGDAQYLLGNRLLDGRGVTTRDDAKSVAHMQKRGLKLLRQAAAHHDAGNPGEYTYVCCAHKAIGDCYHEGLTVLERNDTLAVQWQGLYKLIPVVTHSLISPGFNP
jgi:TPR repeat protein